MLDEDIGKTTKEVTLFSITLRTLDLDLNVNESIWDRNLES